MRLYFTISFLLLFVLFSLKAEKRALIVAIGKYSSQSGWKNINSENDVPIIKSALIKQGFRSENIDVLLNQKATKAGIVNALDSLIDKSKANDVVVFHFSGHGQQVTDTNGDERDELDEALVSYDAQKTRTTLIPDARFHFLDDELNVYLNKLRTKMGINGDVLFFIDACHSGTATRFVEDEEGTRGTNQIFEIPGYPIHTKVNEENSFYKDIPDSRSGTSSRRSPFILLSACLAYQTNKEYKNCGSLSYALGKVLSKNMTNKSYQSFFEAVRSEMIPLMTNNYGVQHDQTPQIEGYTERKVFAGKAINIPQYFSVNNVKGQRISVNAGNLAGIFPGAELSFYPADTYDKTKCKPMVVCKVDTSNLLESILTLPKNVDKNKITSSWVFVNKYRYYTSTHETPAQMRARVWRNATSISKDVSFRILPLNSKGKQINIYSKIKCGNTIFKYSDRFVIEVTNNSSIPIFFQLVDIAPTDEISLVMGRRVETKEDYHLAPRQTKLFNKDILKVDPGSPLGLETIVLIASEKLLDLSPIQTQKQGANRGDSSEFEKWINELYSGERSISVFELNKTVIDKKSFIVKEK